ncbi:polysaccharide deacetylase family protein [Magnetococcales bacterium HHB-1]
MRKKLLDLFSLGLYLTGIPWLVRHICQRHALSILVYHDPTPETFDQHLNYLKKHYTLVSMGDAVHALREERLASLGPAPMVITIDDGRADNIKLLPVIQRHKIRPIIYLCSQVVGTDRLFWDDLVIREMPEQILPLKRMTEEKRRTWLKKTLQFDYETCSGPPAALSLQDLQALAPYVDFGSHGRFHQPMIFLSEEERTSELKMSRQEIQRMTHSFCEHFSYPSGFHDQKSYESVTAQGYVTARTTEFGYNRTVRDLYHLKVTGASDDAALVKLAVQSTGILRLIKQRDWQNLWPCT